MATVATPMGAEPVNTLSASGSFTGKIRHIKIANAYGTAIFYGDFVKLVAAGTVEKAAVTTSVVAGTVGIFVGCAYTDPSTNQMTFNQLLLMTLLLMLLTILSCCSVCKVMRLLLKPDLETTSQRLTLLDQPPLVEARTP